MKTKRKAGQTWRNRALWLLMLAVSGCGGGGGNSGSTTTLNGGTGSAIIATTHTFQGLQFGLASDRSQYLPGAPVPVTFTVINTTQAPITINTGSCSAFEVDVFLNNQRVYKGTPTGPCVASTTTIAAGQTLTYTFSWPGTDQQGNAVAPGRYEIDAGLTALRINDTYIVGTLTQNQVAANPINITVISP